MMNSLFSSFDPNSSYMSFNYVSILIIFSFPILDTYFSKKFRTIQNMMSTTVFMQNELKSTINNSNTKGKLIMLTSTFGLVLLLNLMGLTPYVFTLTAHMLLALSLAFPFWLGFILMTITKNTNHFLSHLVPLSTPLPLSQFMTLIESISQIIRPITLSVRLSANMTAGHILMALTSAPIFMLNQYSLVLTVLLLLELAVAFIQSYVFTLLLTMYLSETY